MNKSNELLETIELLESDPFRNHGFSIDKHVIFSADTIRNKLNKQNKIFGPKHITHGKGKRIISIYKVKEKDDNNKSVENHYGLVHHKTEINNPLDINVYKLKKKSRKITELFNHSYDYDKNDTTENGDLHHYSFSSDKGQNYKVTVRHKSNNEINVNFKNAETGMKINKNEINSSHKVLGTVKRIVKDHIDRHPEIKKVSFTSDVDEPSRTKLYHTIANNMAHKYDDEEGVIYHHFSINKKDLK